MAQIPSFVNAWTQWGTLREVVVGKLPDDACFPPVEPNSRPQINDIELAKRIDWPRGPKPWKIIQLANSELDNLAEVLASECVSVSRDHAYNTELECNVDFMQTKVSNLKANDANVKSCSQVKEVSAGRDIVKQPVLIKRPTLISHETPLQTPTWKIDTQSGNGCPRDVMITIGNTILEATMSKRSRSFEWMAYRNIVNDWRRRDPLMLHKCAPRPTFNDSMYDTSFWELSNDERLQRQHRYSFVINEDEVVFDAADITRVGKDIFVQKSMTTNNAGIDWLRREYNGIVRVNSLHFPYDLTPSHIDCNFIPLRPPRGLHGSQGIVLYNPDRPPLESEMALWYNNNWRLVCAPEPAFDKRPCFSQSSRWLSMNMLSISEKVVIIEENELPMYQLLTDLGFDVITVPFRNFYEFGGSIHCSTWDICRDDACVDYFPDRSDAADRFNNFEGNDQHWNLNIVLPLKDHPFLEERLPENLDIPNEMLTSENTGTERKNESSTGHFVVEGDHHHTWQHSPTMFTADSLRIHDMPVMESWERPYMRRLADVVAAHGGRILEVGWGLHLAGSRIQEYEGIVDEHHVIEGNASVFEDLQAFANAEAAKRTEKKVPRIIPHFGMWQDLLPSLLEQYGEGYFDGILYDAYPQDRKTQHTHQFDFIKAYWAMLREGGVFTYCNLTSIGELSKKYDGQLDAMFDNEHRPKLRAIGFWNIPYPIKFKFSEETKRRRGQCEYYMLDSALVPTLIKKSNYSCEKV